MQILELLQKYYYGNYNHIIYHSVIFAAIVVGANRFSKLSTGSRIFFLLLLLTPIAELTGFYFAIKYKNNSPVSNTFILIEYTLFCMAFYIDSCIKAVPILCLGGLLFCVINSLFFQNYLLEQATNTTLILSLCEIVIYFLFLVSYFKTVDTSPVRTFPLFWIGLGAMIFSIVSIVAFGFLEFSKKGENLYTVSRYVRQYSNYLLYLLYIPAFMSPQKCLRDFLTGK